MPEDGIILRAFSIIGRKGEAEGAGAGHFIGLCLSLSLSLGLGTKKRGLPPSRLSGYVRFIYLLAPSGVSLRASERKKVCP